MKKTLFFLLSFFLVACGSDDLSNTRAYAEGKISTSSELGDINISITSENKVVAQTVPNSKGTFVLSGPLFSDGFTINFNKKVESFSTDKSSCVLSKDSLSIIVPSPISYIVFKDVKLKK